MNFAAAPDSFARSSILVLSDHPSHQKEFADLARDMGFHASATALKLSSPTSWTETDAVLLIAEDGSDAWRSLMESIRQDEVAPPIVVFGPMNGSRWRDLAVKAGAFVCGSLEAPGEELRSLLSAAVRYRSLQKEINLLRLECERICLGLLKSYGQAAANLKTSTDEVHALQESLREIRNRIIRAFV